MNIFRQNNMSEDQHLMDLPAAKKQKLDDSIREQTETSAETTENGVSLEISDKEPTGDQVYSNLVTPEEFEKLREFKVLDEVKSNDEDSNDEDSDSSDGSCVFEYILLAWKIWFRTALQ